MIGDVVRRHRHRLEITQEELAARTGVGLRTIRDVESDRGTQRRASTVGLLADSFGLAGEANERFHRLVAGLDGVPEPVCGPVPAQLPPDVPGFTGRVQALARLDAVLAAGERLVVLSGSPGVGTTTLAVQWGHRVGHRFPDGRLYLNLRGYVGTAGPGARPFPRALGVPPGEIPGGVDEAAGLCLSWLSGRRPGLPGCGHQPRPADRVGRPGWGPG
jgi:hypothetical protein